MNNIENIIANANASYLDAFGVAALTTTTPKKGASLKEVKNALMAQLEADKAPTWRGINAALAARNWAVTPSKAVYVAYWGEEKKGGKGEKVWKNVEARWASLQATSAIFVSDWGCESLSQSDRLAVYKYRKAKLFQQVRDLLDFHGIDIGRDLKPADLIAIGESALRFTYVADDGEVEAKAASLTNFIKATIYGLLGRKYITSAVDKLCDKARRLEKSQIESDPDWAAENKPKFLRG